MKKTRLNESERITELGRYEILDTPPEDEFDELTELAALICKTPIAAITLVARDRQWFKSITGLDLKETARDIAFCSHTIEAEDPFIISDALADVRFIDNPLVTGQQNLRFYAGVPIVSPLGYALGSFCVIDRVPRSLDAAQIRSLQLLAEQVVEKLNLRLHRREAAKLLLERDQGIAEKLKADELAQLQSERLLHTLETISDTFFMLDHDWRFTYVNRVGEILGRRSRGELLGKCIWDEYPSLAGTLFEREYKRSVAEQVPIEFEAYFERGEAWLEARVYPSKDGLSIYLRDITSRRVASEDAARTHRALQLIRRSNETLIRATHEDELLNQICQIAVDIGNYSVGWVGLMRHDEAQSIEVVAHAAVKNYFEYFSGLQLSWSGDVATGRGPAGRTIRGGEMILCEDFEREEGFSFWIQRARQFGFRAGVFLPLIDKGMTFGLLALYASKALTIGPEESTLLQDLARDLAFGIVTIRAREQQHQIQQAVQQQAALLDQASDSIVALGSDHRVTYWNKGAERLYGWNQEEAIGKSLIELTAQHPETLESALRIVHRSNEWFGETLRRRKDGSLLTAECRWTLVNKSDNHAMSILAIDTNISERRAAEEEIRHLAFYDQLTNLVNRQHLIQRLETVLKVCNRTGEMGALLFIDLDNFKIVNDSLGHDKGDVLLKQVATRLLDCVRETDTVARIGGDEFLIMLDNLGKHLVIAGNRVKEVSIKILAALSLPFKLAEFEHYGTGSIGISMIHQGMTSPEEILKQADLAMYQAKSSGGNLLQFFDPAMQEQVTARAQLEKELREAIRLEQHVLYYQPQIDHLGRIIGAEALVRWQHPTRGIVMPNDFIPLAEETGLILSLGLWVLRSACKQLAIWANDAETDMLSISVNVSVMQFRNPDFTTQIMQVVTETGINPSRLKLEITESMLANNIESIITKMAALKAFGIGFSLDDFGTGYSSLSYLRRMPLDQLKIDKSFVQDVLTDPNAAAIARVIITLGQSLKLAVIAEGVETIEQRDFLQMNGCLVYQGYFYSRPLALENFSSFLAVSIVNSMP